MRRVGRVFHHEDISNPLLMVHLEAGRYNLSSKFCLEVCAKGCISAGNMVHNHIDVWSIFRGEEDRVPYYMSSVSFPALSPPQVLPTARDVSQSKQQTCTPAKEVPHPYGILRNAH